MDAATLAIYRQRLLDQQQRLVGRIDGIQADLHTLESEREITRMDHVQADVPEEVLTALDEQSRQEVAAIQAALQRIEAGTYGICVDCGEDIAPPRLAARPMAGRCVSCQERLEQRTKEPV